MKKRLKVLVACEYSGTVRDAFTRKGHRAVSCDIIPSESPGEHIQDDVLNHLNLEKYQWDLIIAHPPCTYLSNAGARHLYPKGQLNEARYKKGLDAKNFFMCFYNMDCKVAVENPIPSTIFELPKYDQIIQPYEYGHPFQKKTCLWLKNLPKLKPTNIVTERQSTKIPGNWYNKGGKERQKNRARFFKGIADAMADQWG
tara:strand:+ start:134 stop:730 length:597 start_codon:yes stop_codon:yes gene_type:complete